jgi:hypothetical protein
MREGEARGCSALPLSPQHRPVESRDDPPSPTAAQHRRMSPPPPIGSPRRLSPRSLGGVARAGRPVSSAPTQPVLGQTPTPPD